MVIRTLLCRTFSTGFWWPKERHSCLTFMLLPLINDNCVHLSFARGCCVRCLLLFIHSYTGGRYWLSVKPLACICSGSGLAAIHSQRRNRCCRVGAQRLVWSIGRRRQKVQTQSITIRLWLMFQLNVCSWQERNTIDLKLYTVGKLFLFNWVVCFCFFAHAVFIGLNKWHLQLLLPRNQWWSQWKSQW